MITVAIETATAAAAVAVMVDGSPPVERLASSDRHHTESLLPALAALLGEVGEGPATIDRIVVDVGPGLFTGLRVGVATARSLATARGLDLHVISSLELLAAGIGEGDVTAVVDARRGEVFVESFHLGGPRPRSSGPATVMEPAALAAALERGAVPTTLVGDGATRYGEQLDAAGGRRLVGRDVPSPGIAAALAAAGVLGDGVDPTMVLPQYLRDPDAVANFQVASGLRPGA